MFWAEALTAAAIVASNHPLRGHVIARFVMRQRRRVLGHKLLDCPVPRIASVRQELIRDWKDAATARLLFPIGSPSPQFDVSTPPDGCAASSSPASDSRPRHIASRDRSNCGRYRWVAPWQRARFVGLGGSCPGNIPPGGKRNFWASVINAATVLAQTVRAGCTECIVSESTG